MGLKLFKKNKKKKNEQIARDAFKAAETPTKVGAGNAAVTTPDTIASPGSPVPQQDYIMEASTPNAMNIERPEPTSFNQRIMESETPLVSNLATASSVSSQFGRERSAPRLDNTNTQPLVQTKSNQIRDEIGQYYDERDREDAMMVSPPESTKMNTTNNVTEKRTLDPIQDVKARSSSPPVTTTYSRQHVDNIGVRAFSTDESEDVEVQLSNHLPAPPNTKTKGGNISSRHPRGRGLSSKLIPPKFVSKINHDEVSVPSLITEPETQDVEKPEQTHQQKQQRSSSTKPSSLDNMIDKGQQSIDDAIKSIFGEGTMKSVATQAGGIENLLGLLQCGGDTVFGCDALCGPGEVVKDAVDLENEQEQKFAMKFNNEIIRDGIKVIYHEPPTKTSSSPDWTQSTVKIFLRPGDCHGKKLLQPSLVWTLLQVASNRFNDDDPASFNTLSMWHKLELMDIDSIMVAPEEQLSASNLSSGNNSVSTSPFFSITTQSTGTVHIFEAASVMERDYIIRGMKGIISRLAFNIIAGNTDVVGEHYSEDAGQMTGELPSLRSPRQAVRDLTHAFLDQ